MCGTKNEMRYATKEDLLPNNIYVSKLIWRMRDMYLSVSGKYGKCRIVCGTQNRLRIHAQCINRIQRMRGKNICIHGSDAKKLLAYSPSTPKDTKLSKEYEYIPVNNGPTSKF
jgi:hypothetical protein